jgi:hypothetical protein
MGLDPGSAGPYGATSAQNTGIDWLKDFTKVDAKLDAMVDYAVTMSSIATDLMIHRIRLSSQINELLQENAFGGGFPELRFAQVLHGQNLAEFTQYLQKLHDGIDHTANAAKAISDSFRGGDAFASADLNAVQFAFGDTSAKKPGGFPPQLGQTFSQYEAAAAAKGDDTKPNKQWQSTGTTDDNGVLTETFVDQYGDVRTITSYKVNGQDVQIVTDPDGSTVTNSTTYTVNVGSGTLTSTTSTTTDEAGKTSTSNTDEYSDGWSDVTDRYSDGQLKSETTVTYNADGTVTTSNYAVGPDGKRTLMNQVTVGGGDAPPDYGPPDSPLKDTVDELKAAGDAQAESDEPQPTFAP